MSLLTQALNNVAKLNTQRPAYSGGTARPLGLFGSSSPSGQQAQMRVYGQIAWLFATVQRIAESTAAVEWSLFQQAQDGEATEILDNGSLSLPLHVKRLWQHPNPFYTRSLLVETSSQHFELVGEAYWLKVRNNSRVPVELWPIRPDRIAPVPHPTEYIAGYMYRDPQGGMIALERDDVIFMRRPSPTDPYRGQGVVQALMTDLDSERLASLWTRNFFDNSAEPGGILQFDHELSQADFERLVSRWQQQHKGVANAHRVAVLEGGQFIERKFTQREMQFEQLRKLNRDIITGAFGLPAALLGVSENVNRANAEAAEVMFSRWVVRPRLMRIQETLNDYIATIFGEEMGLRFEFKDPTPADRELDLKEAVEGYEAGLLTLNEARQRIGEPQVEGEEGDARREQPASLFGQGLTGLYSGRARRKQADMDSLRDNIQKAWRERLSTEARNISEYIEPFFTRTYRQKLEPTDLDGYDWDWWSKYGDDVVEELVSLYEAELLTAAPNVPPGVGHRLAVEYAETRAARLLRVDGDQNIVAFTRRRVQELTARAIDEGRPLREFQKSLQEDFAFSPRRAETVARTETAFAQGQGGLGAAKQIGMDEKRWFKTQDFDADCIGNDEQGWIPIQDPFQSGHETVPAHPNCTCSVSYRTVPQSGADAAEGLDDDIQEAIRESREERVLSEVRCPECNRRQPVNGIRGIATLYCRHCKIEFQVDSSDGERIRQTRKRIERDESGKIAFITEEVIG